MPRLSSGLPKEADRNGLYALAARLLNDPSERHLVLAVVDCSKISIDTDTGEREATVRVLRIEAVAPMDRTEAERLVRRALEYRTREEVLPIEMERDLEEWFGTFTFDPKTGELTVPDDDTTAPTPTTHQAAAASDEDVVRHLLEDLDGDLTDDADGEQTGE